MSDTSAADSNAVASRPARDVLNRRCISRSTFEDLTAKWAALVLVALTEGSHRFGELRRRVDGISERMLSRALQSLERDGMVQRIVHSAIPPHVTYALTPLGEPVAQQLRSLADVLEASGDAVRAARQAFDDRAHASEPI